MDFGLSVEISKDIFQKSLLITSLSNEIETYFQYKDYGTDIQRLTIGIICVKTEADFFFKKRKKYTKKKKLLEYDIKIDHKILKSANEIEVIKIILEEIQKSFYVFNKINLNKFNSIEFMKDFSLFSQVKQGTIDI